MKSEDPKLVLRRISGNRYSVSDEFAAAELDLLGSAEGFLVDLKSYRIAAACKEEVDSVNAVVEWLAAKLSAERAFQQFAIAYRGAVVFSRGRP